MIWVCSSQAGTLASPLHTHKKHTQTCNHTGTFVYVALMEVVPKELEDGRHRGLKMAAMLLGFGLMSLLAVWA